MFQDGPHRSLVDIGISLGDHDNRKTGKEERVNVWPRQLPYVPCIVFREDGTRKRFYAFLRNEQPESGRQESRHETGVDEERSAWMRTLS